MHSRDLLHIGITDLPPVRVAHKLCLFRVGSNRPYKQIHATFQALREWLVTFDLDPDSLLHIGIPVLDEKLLVTYGCCIEFPLPIDSDRQDIDVQTLPGGRYAILRIEKTPAKISRAIRQFQADYLPEHHIRDENRPVYEIYYRDTMEYCVPVIDG
jgi:AraC family transcriptional regulator